MKLVARRLFSLLGGRTEGGRGKEGHGRLSSRSGQKGIEGGKTFDVPDRGLGSGRVYLQQAQTKAVPKKMPRDRQRELFIFLVPFSPPAFVVRQKPRLLTVAPKWSTVIKVVLPCVARNRKESN